MGRVGGSSWVGGGGGNRARRGDRGAGVLVRGLGRSGARADIGRSGRRVAGQFTGPVVDLSRDRVDEQQLAIDIRHHEDTWNQE